MVEALRQLIPIFPFGSGPAARVALPPIHALLAWIGVSLILLPLLPGLVQTLLPALSLDVWSSLLSNNLFPAALAVTLFS